MADETSTTETQATNTDTAPDKGGNSTGGQQGGAPAATTPKTFTQEEVDRLIGDRARRAKESGISDLLRELGMEDADTLKALVATAQERSEAEKSEIEKAQGAAEKAAKEAADWKAKYEAEAAARRQDRLDTALLMAAGKAIKPEQVVALIKADYAEKVAALLNEDGSVDKKGVESLLGQFEKDNGHLFNAPGRQAPGSLSNHGGRAPDINKEARQRASKTNRRMVSG